jgi:outer membrane protein assembly factor BamB
MRDIPVPSFAWLTGGSKKPGPMPNLTATITPRINWQHSVGAAGPGIAPALTTSAIYAAAKDATLTRLDPATGRAVWRISAGQPQAQCSDVGFHPLVRRDRDVS